MGLERYDSLDPDEQLLHPFLGSVFMGEKHASPDRPSWVCGGDRSTAMLNTYPFALTAPGRLSQPVTR